MNVQEILTDVAKNGVAIALVEMVDVVNKVPVKRNELTNRLKQGATYTLARDLVDWWSGQPSDVMTMNYRGLIDSTVWNGSVGYAADKTGVASAVNQSLRGVSPFDTYINDVLIDGAILTTAMTTRDMANRNPMWMNSPLRYLTNASSLVL